MIPVDPAWPERLSAFLQLFDLKRGQTLKRGWLVPSPARKDENPSVWVTVTEDRIMVKDRTGKDTLSILSAVGATWRDLYTESEEERNEFAGYLTGRRVGASSQSQSAPAVENVGLRHNVYSVLLNELDLSEEHRTALLARGFTDDSIERFGYRSYKLVDRARVGKILAAEFGGVVAAVPGCGATTATMTDRSGLLIPVRTMDGRIQSLKVRRDRNTIRYAWFGEGVVSLPHHSPPWTAAPDTVGVTEGELKADRASLLLPYPVLAVPGMDQWRDALPSIAACGCRRVVLLFDREPDPEKQRIVDANTDAMSDHLIDNGYRVEEERWEAA